MGLREKLDKLEKDFKVYKDKPKYMTMPKIPIIYIYLNGKYNKEFELHDQHYKCNSGVSRKEADLQLYVGICLKGKSWLSTIFAMMTYLAVRGVGWYHYNTPD